MYQVNLRINDNLKVTDDYLFIGYRQFVEVRHESDNTAFLLFNEQLDTDSGHVIPTHLLVPKTFYQSN